MSRRERRQLMREQGGAASRGGSRWLRRVMLWGGMIAIVALIGWGMVKLSEGTPIPAGNGTLTVPVSEQDNVLGPEDAPVTLVEYSDFQCPACAAFYPIVKQALAEPQLKDKVRFVYRSFPLTNIHPNALMAAHAAQAAALQGKFWEMHDKLFDGQKSWSPLSGAAARAIINGYSSTIGLDVAKFDDDIESGAVKDRVREQINGGNSAGVDSTPTFFVNGREMAQPQSYEQFRQFLIDALNATP